MTLFPNDQNTPERHLLDFHWAAASRSGTKKPNNDDAFLLCGIGAQGPRLLQASDNTWLEQEDLIFAVSDGMGGAASGDIASRTILEQISQRLPETLRLAAQGFYPDYIERLEDSIRSTHQAINELGANDPALKGMSATLTLAWFTPDNLYLGHVGDTRLYRCRDAEVSQLSEDHTFVWKQWKRGQMNEIAFRSHPRRSALYEAIGGGHDTTVPFLQAFDYQPGDRYLFCTDGLIDGLWERHIHEALLDSSKSPQALCNQLLHQAYEASGKDDTTLIILDIKHRHLPI